jgi:hypothetical protein
MKRTIFVLICSIGLLIAKAQPITWKTVSHANEITVAFPGDYTQLEVAGQPMYRLKLADSTANLSFMIRDLSAAGISAEEMDTQAKEDQFWQDYVTGYMGQLTGASLETQERKNLGNIPGCVITYKLKDNILTQWLLVKGHNNYIITFNSRGGKGSNTVKNEFFDKVKSL